MAQAKVDDYTWYRYKHNDLAPRSIDLLALTQVKNGAKLI